MSYRYYDDTPARGSRKADPSIDAWFRELRGDAAPTEVRSAAAASRQRQRELDAEPGGWHRGNDEPRRPAPAPAPAHATESWNVETRTWSPDWDTNATNYMPRAAGSTGGHRGVGPPAGSSPREGIAVVPHRDRRSTGDHPRVPDHRSTGDQPRIADRRPEPAPLGDRRATGEQARIADWRPAEPHAIEARPPEGRSAEIRDLNEAREMREARAARPARPAAHSRDSYDTTYEDLTAYRSAATPPPAPARSRTPAAAIAPTSAPVPAPPAQSPAPAYIPAPAAAAAYTPAPASTPPYSSATYAATSTPATSHRSYAATPSFGAPGLAPTEYMPSLTPYTQGSLAAAPSYAEPRRDTGGYAATEYTGTLLPEPRHADTQFDVVLPDSIGNPMLAFKNGQWFRLGAGGLTSSPITVRSAVLDHADLAGSVVQIVCWWMRENSRRERALDIATELALAVTELTHIAELRKKTPAFY